MLPNVIAEQKVLESKRLQEIKQFFRLLLSRRIVAVGFFVIISLIVVAVFEAQLAPHDPYQQNLDQVLLKPSAGHILGTDSLGRDVFSRIIYGTRTALLIGLCAVAIGALGGTILGLVAGYFGGLIYTVIMRLVDALMAFPALIFALVISALLGGGLRNILLAIGLSLMPAFARLVCGQVLQVKENEYITAARSMGASNLRIIVLHVLPNCLSPFIVMVTMTLGIAILAEASLSFLGIGIKPPMASWGGMVYDGYGYLMSNPILSFAPGLAIMLSVFVFNMVGDGLRDALDPRLKD